MSKAVGLERLSTTPEVIPAGDESGSLRRLGKKSSGLTQIGLGMVSL